MDDSLAPNLGTITLFWTLSFESDEIGIGFPLSSPFIHFSLGPFQKLLGNVIEKGGLKLPLDPLQGNATETPEFIALQWAGIFVSRSQEGSNFPTYLIKQIHEKTTVGGNKGLKIPPRLSPAKSEEGICSHSDNKLKFSGWKICRTSWVPVWKGQGRSTHCSANEEEKNFNEGKITARRVEIFLFEDILCTNYSSKISR